MADDKRAARRKEFELKASDLSETLNKLRKGTGEAVALLMMQAWDQGYRFGADDAHKADADLLKDEAQYSAYAAELFSTIRDLAEKEGHTEVPLCKE